jgi:peptide/nickel transport system permease protein
MSRTSFIGFCILSTFLVIAIVAPFIAPYDPWKPGYSFLHPSLAHPLGTNDIGQDIFSELVYNARISLFIGFFAAFISMIIGTLIGLISGFFWGMVDKTLLGLTEL